MSKEWKRLHPESVKASNKRYQEKPEVRERMKLLRKRYALSPKGKAKTLQWKQSHPEKVNEMISRENARPETKERKRSWARERARTAKLQVLLHYGGNPPRCGCCGETIKEFLCIDHIYGNGCQERKRLKLSSGSGFYLWLIRQGFPKGYQVLCANCNLGKSIRGVCPHLNHAQGNPVLQTHPLLDRF